MEIVDSQLGDGGDTGLGQLDEPLGSEKDHTFRAPEYIDLACYCCAGYRIGGLRLGQQDLRCEAYRRTVRVIFVFVVHPVAIDLISDGLSSRT